MEPEILTDRTTLQDFLHDRYWFDLNEVTFDRERHEFRLSCSYDRKGPYDDKILRVTGVSDASIHDEAQISIYPIHDIEFTPESVIIRSSAPLEIVLTVGEGCRIYFTELQDLQYPIFMFDGNDVIAFERRSDHWSFLEAYDIPHPDILLDSAGRPLVERDAGNDRVNIFDPGAKPDPERLRVMLIEALKGVGQEWSGDPPLHTVVAAGLGAFRVSSSATGFGRFIYLALSAGVSSLLALARLKDPTRRVVTVKNNSSQRLTVYQKGVATQTLLPGQSQGFTYKRFEGTEILDVKRVQDDTAGKTVVRQSFTWNQLGQRRLELVIK